MKRYAITALLTLTLTAACTDTYEGPEQDEYRYDMVTYQGFADGNALFENVPRGDGASTYLAGTMRAEPAYTIGTRVLLSYDISADAPAAGSSADNPQLISVRTVSAATTDTLRHTAKENIDAMGNDPIQLMSIWRTGCYLNLQGEVQYTGKSRFFLLLADDATLENDTIDCYLINDQLQEQAYNWRRFYASFYVGGALLRPTCKALRVYLNDEKYTHIDNYCFSRQD